MEQTLRRFNRPLLTYGLIVAAVLISLNFLIWALHLDIIGWVRWANRAIIFTTIYLVFKHHRDAHLGGILAYWKAVKTGTIIFLLASLGLGLYNILYFTYIDPDAINRALVALEETYIAFGFTDAQVDAFVGLADDMMRKPMWQIFSTAFQTTLQGLFFSLIAGLFVHRKDPDPFKVIPVKMEDSDV